MALNPLYQIEQLPTTDQAAIREFNDRYLMAMAAAKPTGWADTLGDLIPTNSPLVTFPVSQLRTKYTRTTGDNKFKKLRSASFDVKTEEFDDGYQAAWKDITKELFAYRRWQEAPGRLVLAEEQFRHSSIATLLEAGTSTTCVDGQNFFSATHPCNIGDSTVGTSWSNYQSSTKDVISISNIQAEVTAMMGVKDENGNVLGVMPDTIICPIAKAEGLKNLLAQQMVLAAATTATSNGAVNNPYFGRFNVIVAKELTDVDDWYLVDSKLVAQGFAPWVALRETVAAQLALRSYDTSSDFFKNTGDIKMSSHIWYGFGLALPHAIRLIKGA